MAPLLQDLFCPGGAFLLVIGNQRKSYPTSLTYNLCLVYQLVHLLGWKNKY